MYALIKFYDNVYYVCHTKDIAVRNGITKCKYSDGYRYRADIIAKNSELKCFAYIIFMLLL